VRVVAHGWSRVTARRRGLAAALGFLASVIIGAVAIEEELRIPLIEFEAKASDVFPIKEVAKTDISHKKQFPIPCFKEQPFIGINSLRLAPGGGAGFRCSADNNPEGHFISLGVGIDWIGHRARFTNEKSIESLSDGGWSPSVIEETKSEVGEHLSHWLIGDRIGDVHPRLQNFESNEWTLQFAQGAFGDFGASVIGNPQQDSRYNEQSIKEDEQPIGKLVWRFFRSLYGAGALGLCGGLIIGWWLSR
jgi:hypothetical protein